MHPRNGLRGDQSASSIQQQRTSSKKTSGEPTVTAARYEATRPPPWHRPTVQRQRVRLWVELPSEEDIWLWLKEELLELLRR